MKTSILRDSLLAAAITLAAAGPALADPPWKHGGPPGWSKHHHGWDHKARHGWGERYGYYYGPPTVIYGPPRVVYVPPPVVYPPRRPGISIHLPLDLD